MSLSAAAVRPVTVLSHLPGRVPMHVRAVVGFIAVFAATQSLALLSVMDAFAADPRSAGWVLLVRSLPAFAVGWLTGYAVDFHRTRALSLVVLVLVLAVAGFAAPLVPAMFITGLVMAWAEVSIAAFLAQHSPWAAGRSAVTLGLSYDLGKVIAAPFALVMTVWVGHVAGAVLAAVGVWLLRDAYSSTMRARRGSTRQHAWSAAAVFPVAVAVAVNLGAGNYLWQQAAHAASLPQFLTAAAGFSVGAVTGNLTLLRVPRSGYGTAVVGVAVMAAAVVTVTVTGSLVAPVGVAATWAVWGWAAAWVMQSLRAESIRADTSGRGQALFTTSVRVANSAGAVALSLLWGASHLGHAGDAAGRGRCCCGRDHGGSFRACRRCGDVTAPATPLWWGFRWLLFRWPVEEGQWLGRGPCTG